MDKTFERKKFPNNFSLFPTLLLPLSLRRPFLSHNISSTSGLKELALVKRRNILVLHLSSCSKLVPTEIQARLQRSQLARLRSSLDPLKPVCSAKCFQWRERETHTRPKTRVERMKSKRNEGSEPRSFPSERNCVTRDIDGRMTGFNLWDLARFIRREHFYPLTRYYVRSHPVIREFR